MFFCFSFLFMNVAFLNILGLDEAERAKSSSQEKRVPYS